MAPLKPAMAAPVAKALILSIQDGYPLPEQHLHPPQCFPGRPHTWILNLVAIRLPTDTCEWWENNVRGELKSINRSVNTNFDNALRTASVRFEIEPAMMRMISSNQGHDGKASPRMFARYHRNTPAMTVQRLISAEHRR
jgi:hypothetical protein